MRDRRVNSSVTKPSKPMISAQGKIAPVLNTFPIAPKEMVSKKKVDSISAYFPRGFEAMTGLLGQT